MDKESALLRIGAEENARDYSKYFKVEDFGFMPFALAVIAGLLVLICGFYISFSFVTQHYEAKAKEYAISKAKTDDVTNEVYKLSLKQFNDSLDKEDVYLGYTYNQVRKMEIGLGLDLKGGMNVTMEVSVKDILHELSGHCEEQAYIDAIEAAENANADDYLAVFFKSLKDAKVPYANIFSSITLQSS